MSLQDIKNRFEAWKDNRSTAPLPPDDCEKLIVAAEALDGIVSSCRSTGVFVLGYWDAVKALEDL